MAMLEKNGSDGRFPGNYDLTWQRETIRCTAKDCNVSYTYLYRNEESRIDLTVEPHENVIDKMRRAAEKTVNGAHSSHSTQTHKWDGSKWAEADSMAARRLL
jgi:hypothetical protein